MKQPLILNFDQSVGLKDCQSIDLHSFQEKIRFGCGWQKWQELTAYLDETMPKNYGAVMLGSGDYHHLSLYLIERLARKIQRGFQVVVFDNHPDNMRFPFGIHCGSWISHIAKLSCIDHIHVVGITSSDVTIAHSWETRLKPLFSKKLTNWCIGVKTNWTNTIGLGNQFRTFGHKDQMLEALQNELRTTATPTYLSIDKDVFAKEVVRTNWDQGILLEEDVMAVIDLLQPNLIGSDITGEVSMYAYQTWWKRLLSGLDEQISISNEDIEAWQQAQNALNERLLMRLSSD